MSATPSTPTGQILRRLLLQKGIDRFAPFLTQQEGRMLPGGIESVSGFVLTGEGELYGFWLDWDDREKGYVLEPWYRIEDPAEFAGDPDYQQARRQLGLE